MFPLQTTFRLAAECGFEAIELVMAPEIWLRGPRYVSRLAREYGLQIPTVHQAILQHSPSGGGPRRALDAVNFGIALGSHHVVIHGTWARRWAEPGAQRWLRVLATCRDRLDGSDTRLALENHGLRVPSDAEGVLGQLPVMYSFAERHDLDITLDTCHAGSYDLDIVAAYDIVRPRLVNVHLCDIKPAGRLSRCTELRSMSTQHQMVGEGLLPFGRFLQRLVADGYCGPLTVEISPFALQAWSPRRRRQRLMQAVAYIEQALGGQPLGSNNSGVP